MDHLETFTAIALFLVAGGVVAYDWWRDLKRKMK